MGQGRHIEKRIKLKILQDKADELNRQRGFFEQNYYTDWDEENAEQTLKEEKNAKTLLNLTEKDLQIDTDDKVNTFGYLNIGLKNDQQFISSIKKRYLELEEFFKNPSRIEQIQIAQNQQNEEIKKQNYIDHIFEYFKKNPLKFKNADFSEFQDQYRNTQEMQEMVKDHDFRLHLKKNDLKLFAEIYIQVKHTIRDYKLDTQKKTEKKA